jgi:uncharacterized protein YbbC (DUF1343 family)
MISLLLLKNKMLSFGIDNLILQNPIWKKQRIGLLTNHAATTNQLQPSRQALLQNGFNVVQLFSPEHGLDVQGADGAVMNDSVDALTQLPITSLYSHKLAPTAEDLKDIEIMLFDVPDIGCRFYTYLWSLTYLLEACKQNNKPLIVLDRPNPISGFLPMTEGPMLDEEYCSSFIGRWEIPLKHGCTIGELALYFNQTKNIHAKLEIIKCSFWKREMMHPSWGIDFVPTSPAIRNFKATLLYPGLGLLEATNISEGRGTNKPFQLAGAPWINGNNVAAAFNHFCLDNIDLKPITFTPTESKYANQLCHGVQFVVTDYPSYAATFTGLLFIRLIKDLYPNHFAWQSYPTNVNPTGKQHLDKLLGIPNSEALFNLSMLAFLQKMMQLIKVSDWPNKVNSFLLYT